MFDSTFEVSKVFALSKFNETYLPSVNRNTFERLDSTSLYNKQFKESFSQVDVLQIVIGLDSGLLANYVINNTIPEGSKFLFVELNSILNLLNIDIPSHQKDKIAVCDLASLPDLLKGELYNLFIVKQQFLIHQSLAVSGHYIDDYTILNQEVEKIIEHEFFERSIGFNQKIFIKKQLENVAENLVPASRLRNSFKGKTCIILGGGPSLDTNLKWIKKNQDKFIIFSVSRLAGKLTEEGIHSDILVSVDPQDHAFEVYREMMPLAGKHLLICSHHVSPQIIGQWNGSVMYTSKRFPWTPDDKCDNFLNAGPTVTNSAIQIADEMGFNRILLCGVDFCHSQTGVTHAQGTYDAELPPNIGKMFEWVETYSGEMAETPIQLLHAARSLQDKVAESPQIDFINLSENAAKVAGVSYCDANSISLTPIDYEFSNILSPDSYLITTSEKELDLKHCIKELTHANERLVKLESLLKDAEKLTNDISNSPSDSHKIGPLSEQLEKIEKRINNSFSAESTLIKFYGYYEFSKFLSTKNSSDWTQSQINQMSKTYYNAYLTICVELQALIDAAMSRTHSRLEELHPRGDIVALVKQWTKDNQSGRALIWQTIHQEKVPLLSSEESSLLNRTITSYQQRLNDKKPNNNVEDINNIQQAHGKLEILFRNKHLLGISKMVQYLHPHRDSNKPEIKALYCLALSYKLTLEGDDEEALNTLLSIAPKQRKENELKHFIKLSLKLNKLDFTLDYFKQIIQYSDEYLPQYAHALRLNDKPQEALNIYLDYLDKYPEDIPVLLKLGIFLAEFGQIDEAKSCFQNALDLDPNNQAAMSYLQQIGY
ncbi:DUF115 domain-containing protein [Shewanella mesophila]|uniref:motility associated factor glycosyltransferase family protein n=1 Tax=Shewanella mesophila TaxID=2864208 RepID=UPI001C6580CB|nr:6-hydroxymethylpterin diphosphokinase MptE-like protein [Shewanella mesophila]QYJ85084.1 DUF115 domain-containing protein [Shewanella mesophila]